MFHKHLLYMLVISYMLGLLLLFHSAIIHGHLPDRLMHGNYHCSYCQRQIKTDKKQILTDKNNYRPIALTCVTSKLLELLILEKCKGVINTSDNQFGFNENHCTDMCVCLY